ncbi:MAG TPA: hypothetical protein VI796_03435 [Candidatus Thermoplasmatota archaeon]|nr:hypothetical protein [Candidatus Thermoplasmatota archaeon]
MATWRIHVVAPDTATAQAFKERFFKKVYSEAGAKVTFEVPETLEKDADAIVAAAKADGFKAEKEKFVDPLESVEGGADFW